ncbi:hypothetical protein BHM03_00044537, partial [Ensete ventricosum]
CGCCFFLGSETPIPCVGASPVRTELSAPCKETVPQRAKFPLHVSICLLAVRLTASSRHIPVSIRGSSPLESDLDRRFRKQAAASFASLSSIFMSRPISHFRRRARSPRSLSLPYRLPRHRRKREKKRGRRTTD